MTDASRFCLRRSYHDMAVSVQPILIDSLAWSAPSAIGTAGLGVGGQAGAELTDFLVVLNSKSAVVRLSP